MAKPAVVYWIHFPSQTNIFTDGYVGISTNLKQRLIQHKCKNKDILNGLLNGAVVDIIEEHDTIEAAALREEYYRPRPSVGWNINKGGDLPPSRKGAVYIKGVHKHRLVGKERTPKQIASSTAHKERMTGRVGNKRGKCMKLTIDGIEYPSYKEAVAATGYSITKVFRIGKQ